MLILVSGIATDGQWTGQVVGMYIVTLSGLFGTGIPEIGVAVATRLGADYVNQQILVDAARRLSVEVAALEGRDERTMTFGERLANLLRNFLERSAVAGAGDPLMGDAGLAPLLARSYSDAAAEAPALDDTRYIQTITAIIQELAAKDSIVIIGRGSQVILRDKPKALHVLTHAPLEARIERIALRDGLTKEEAQHRIHDIDRGRVAFHRKFFKIDVNDPTLYDLVVDTSRLTLESAADVIALAAQRKAEQPPAPGKDKL